MLPCDVPILMHEHIVKEEILEHLWRYAPCIPSLLHGSRLSIVEKC